jgi:hypothetical protein
MLYHVGEYEVERLVRVRIGPVKVAGVAPGEWRLLSSKEVAALRASEHAAAPSKAAAKAKAKPGAERTVSRARRKPGQASRRGGEKPSGGARRR